MGMCKTENRRAQSCLSLYWSVYWFMDLQFKFRESAFKHNVTETDIRHAFENIRTIRQFEDRENVYLLIGFEPQPSP